MRTLALFLSIVLLVLQISLALSNEVQSVSMFVRWASEHGASLNKAQIKEIPGFGRGVVATSTILVCQRSCRELAPNVPWN